MRKSEEVMKFEEVRNLNSYDRKLY
jgi:hypothetical protein